MAKKKKADKPIEEIKAKEVVVESVEEEVKRDYVDEFVTAQLMAINRLPDRAKAKRLAERVLSNRRKG